MKHTQEEFDSIQQEQIIQRERKNNCREFQFLLLFLKVDLSPRCFSLISNMGSKYMTIRYNTKDIFTYHVSIPKYQPGTCIEPSVNLPRSFRLSCLNAVSWDAHSGSSGLFRDPVIRIPRLPLVATLEVFCLVQRNQSCLCFLRSYVRFQFMSLHCGFRTSCVSRPRTIALSLSVIERKLLVMSSLAL